ncbi:hypothetical protein [Sphingomonas sp. LT1P40]|uniref:hypothetical protein n=1 Tax=Alteristakelama amylovorans TaxID=3096166 RepID=UPI002FCABD6D
MRIRTIAAAAVLLAIAPGAAKDKAVPEATPDGEPVDCVPLRQIRDTRVHSDQVIDFRMRGGKTYRNTLPMACPRLGFEERFLYKTSGSELCAIDTVTVLIGPTADDQGASCGLGQFQPVTLTKK